MRVWRLAGAETSRIRREIRANPKHYPRALKPAISRVGPEEPAREGSFCSVAETLTAEPDALLSGPGPQ